MLLNRQRLLKFNLSGKSSGKHRGMNWVVYGEGEHGTYFSVFGMGRMIYTSTSLPLSNKHFAQGMMNYIDHYLDTHLPQK